jgi:hypothetical protein
MKKLLPAFIAAAFAFATGASAQVLLLDFGANPNGTPSGANLTNSAYHTASGNLTNTTWNQVRLADVTSGLIYGNTDAATGVSVNLGRNTTTGTIIGLTSQPASELVGTAVTTGVYAGNSAGRDGIFGTSTTNPVVGIQVGGLSAGTYDVYVAARNTNTGNGQPTYSQNIFVGKTATATNFDYSGYATAGLTYTGSASQQTTFVNSWVLGENYVKLSVTLAGGEYLNLAVEGRNASNVLDRGFLNSVQIVASVPEPSTYAMLGGLAVLGVAILHRRRAAR